MHRMRSNRNESKRIRAHFFRSPASSRPPPSPPRARSIGRADVIRPPMRRGLERSISRASHRDVARVHAAPPRAREKNTSTRHPRLARRARTRSRIRHASSRARRRVRRARARAPPPFRKGGGLDHGSRPVDCVRARFIAVARARSRSIDTQGEITAHYVGRLEGISVGARARRRPTAGTTRWMDECMRWR